MNKDKTASVLLGLMCFIVVISIFCIPGDYSYPLAAVVVTALSGGLAAVCLSFRSPRGDGFTFVSIISFLLVLSLCIVHFRTGGPESDLRFLHIILMAVMYIGFRGVWTCCGKQGDRVLPVVLAMTVIVESVYATVQVFSRSPLAEWEYICRGFFPNPGPLGGYIAAVCVTVAAFLPLKRGKTGRIVLSVCLIAGISLLPVTRSRSAMLSVVACLLLWLALNRRFRGFIYAFLKRKPFFASIMSLSLSILLITAAVGMYRMKRASADGRAFMNRMSVLAMKENGFRGSGLGSYPRAYASAQSGYFSEEGGYTEKERLGADCPQKGFNEFLELGVEAGFLPMALFIILVTFSTYRLLREDSPWGYCLLALSVFSMFSYPLVFVRFRVLYAIAVSRASVKGGSGGTGGLRVSFPVTAVCLSLLVCQAVMIPDMLRHCKAAGEWRATRSWYENGMYLTILDNWSGLYPLMKHNADFLTEYGTSLTRSGLYDESDSVMCDLQRVCSDPLPFNIMAENSRRRADYISAVRWSRKAFSIVPNRIGPLGSIAMTYFEAGDTVRLRQIRDTIESFVPKIESVRTEAVREEVRKLGF